MTIEEFEHSVKDKMMLTPADVAKATNIHPSNIVAMAREGSLPYPHMMSGDHVKIPKGAFLAWWRGENQQKKEPARDGYGRFRVEFAGDTPQDLFEEILGYLMACGIVKANEKS